MAHVIRSIAAFLIKTARYAIIMFLILGVYPMMFINYCLIDHPEKVSDELKAAAEEIRLGYIKSGSFKP